jgi:hypothetical protein
MGRLFRRVVRSARGRTSAKRGSASAIRDASGNRYKVIAVDEAEESKYADPPRKWGRVGVMAGGWAIVLALGAWVAPGIAASGNEENQDPRDQPATDAEGAAWSYLRYGSSQDLDRAEAELCEDASPEVTPEDLDTIRQSYADELGGITRVDLEVGDPVPTSEGISLAGTVYYISEGSQRFEDFLVTVQESDGTYCVSDATQPADDEDAPSDGGSTEAPVDPEVLASEFMTNLAGNRNVQAAEALQCSTYEGITPQDLDAAIDEWAAVNGEPTGVVSVDPAELNESSATVFTAEVLLDGDVNRETFSFQVEVQGDCIASLEGGEGLMDAAGD